MSKTATATIRVEFEYEVEQEFDEGISFEDMDDNWNTFIELPESSIPKEWECVDMNSHNMLPLGSGLYHESKSSSLYVYLYRTLCSIV